MKIKKLLAIIISGIMAFSPISHAVRPNGVVSFESNCDIFITCYLKNNVHIPKIGFSNIKQLAKSIKSDIKRSKNITNVKECYLDYFKQNLFDNLILSVQDSNQVYDIFMFLFNYIIIDLITEELNNQTIDFKTLKKILTYLHSEDMHFLFHTYIISNSNPRFSLSRNYVNNAIKEHARKGKEKPLETTEDLIHKTFRKNSNDKVIITLLKNLYNEQIVNFKDFSMRNSYYLNQLQKSILSLILKAMFNYKKVADFTDPINLYETYFNEAFPQESPH